MLGFLSVKLPIFDLFFKFTCLFLQNNLALLHQTSARLCQWHASKLMQDIEFTVAMFEKAKKQSNKCFSRA